jgi:hypothetical protein
MGFEVGRMDGGLDYRRVVGGLVQADVGDRCVPIACKTVDSVIQIPIGKLVCGSIVPLNSGPTNDAVTLIGSMI